MDQIDMEIKQMLKNKTPNDRSRYIPIPYEDVEKITYYLKLQENKPLIPLEDVINREIDVQGADVSLAGGFTIYTKNSRIHGTFRDNGSTKLDTTLYNLNVGNVYQHRAFSGQYLYIFPHSVSIKVKLEGRLLKHYRFEVENSEE